MTILPKKLLGDCRETLKSLPEKSVHCCVTSVPYWGLRSYLPKGHPLKPLEIGSEPTFDLYLQHIVEAFRAVHRVLRDDGTLFLNVGDSYVGGGRGGNPESSAHIKQRTNKGSVEMPSIYRREGACDTSDKEPASYQASDCLCRNLCDVCRVVYRSHKSHNGGLLVPMLTASLSSPSRARKEASGDPLPTSDFSRQVSHTAISTPHPALAATQVYEQLRAALVSTIGESSPQLLDACFQRAKGGECLLCARSLNDSVQVSAGKLIGPSETDLVCASSLDQETNTHGKVETACACNPRTSDTLSDSSVDSIPSAEKLKPKDLLMMPARVAIALQADGWYLRSQIPWLKRNAMPESCTDRPATAVEYFFLLSKSPKYFYDRYAVMMPVSAATNPRLPQKVMDQIGSERAHAGGKTNGRMKAVGGNVVLQGEGIKSNQSFEGACSMPVSARNKRNTDWFMQSFQGLLTDEGGDPLALIVNPKGTTIAHFASYPPKLIEPLIKAGTSERGCCAGCGAPWERIVHRERNIGGREDGLGAPAQWPDRVNPNQQQTVGWQPTCECHGKLVRGKITKYDAAAWGADTNGEYLGQSTKDHAAHGVQDASDVKARILRNATEDRQIDGWVYESSLPLDQHPVKCCTVLDPFAGTSTTAEVATRLGRHSIMCELNPEYAEAAKQRDSQGGLALL